MEPSIKDNIKMGRNMAKEYSISVITVFMKVHLIIMIFMDVVSMCGQMVGIIRESGRGIKYMEKVLHIGMMEEYMKVSITMIKKMGLVSSNGLMEGSTLDIGRMENNMD